MMQTDFFLKLDHDRVIENGSTADLDRMEGMNSLILKFFYMNLTTMDVDKNQPSLIENGRNDGNPTRKLIQLWVQLSLRPEARIFAFFRKLLFPTLFSHLYKWMNEMAIAVLATTIYRDLQTIHHFDQSTLDYSWVKNTSHCLHIQSAISFRPHAYGLQIDWKQPVKKREEEKLNSRMYEVELA